MGFCGISCEFLWDFLWGSVGFPVSFCGNSHRNPVGMGIEIPFPR